MSWGKKELAFLNNLNNRNRNYPSCNVLRFLKIAISLYYYLLIPVLSLLKQSSCYSYFHTLLVQIELLVSWRMFDAISFLFFHQSYCFFVSRFYFLLLPFLPKLLFFACIFYLYIGLEPRGWWAKWAYFDAKLHVHF